MPLALVPLFGALLYTVLIVLALLARPRQAVHLAFASYLAGMLVYGFGSFAARVQLPGLDTMQWSQLLLLGSQWQVIAYFHFALVFLRLRGRLAALALVVGYSAAILVGIADVAGMIFSESRYVDGVWVIHLSPMVYASYAWITIYIGVTVFLLGRAFARASHETARRRSFYVLAGGLVILLAGYTNLVPALAALPLDQAANAINALCITYAIFRYRLLGLHSLAYSSLVYSTLVATMAGGFALLVLVLDAALDIVSTVADHRSLAFAVAALAVVIAGQPARERLERWAERMVYRRGYSDRMALEAFAQEMLSVLDAETLGRTTLDVLSRTFGVAHVGVWLRSTRAGGYSLVGWEDASSPLGPEVLKGDHAIVRYLLRGGRHLTLEEMELDASFRSLWYAQRTELAANHWELFLALRSRDRLVGVLGLGPLPSGDAYSERDLALLERLTDLASVAFENAALMQDLTEIEALREVNRLKDELVTTVSHELRTPLTLVLGYAELLNTGSLPPHRLQQAASEIFRGAEQLRVLVDDLLDVSRLQTGRFRLQRTQLDMTALVREVAEGMDRTTDLHQFQVEVPSLPLMVYADPSRLRQVLGNLMGNAIKYAPKGGTIQVAVKSDRHTVTVEVSDAGIGIPKQHIGRVFEPFYRVDTPEHRRVSGTGLGLAICKSIVEAHDGHIWVHSEEGKGSTFAFVLPASPNGAAGRA